MASAIVSVEPTPQRGRVKRFLLFASGASWRDIEDLPVEQVRYVSVGAAVLVTSVFASLSLCLLLSTVFGLPAAAFIPLGVFWGLAIFNLDRWIVSTVHYGKARDPDDAARGSKVFSKLNILPRLILAVILGLFISEPLVLRLYRSEIDEEIAKIHNESKAALDASTAERIAAKLAQDTTLQEAEERLALLLKQRGAELEETIKRLTTSYEQALLDQAQYLALEQAARQRHDEQLQRASDEVSLGGGGRPPGPGEVARNAQELADEMGIDAAEAHASYEAAVARTKAALVELNAARDVLTDSSVPREVPCVLLLDTSYAGTEQPPATDAPPAVLIGALRNQIAVQQRRVECEVLRDDQLAREWIDASQGLLIRQEALHRITASENSSVGHTVWLPRGVILLLDVLPVFLKLFAPESVHDRRVRYDAAAKSIRARVEFERETRWLWSELESGEPAQGRYRALRDLGEPMDAPVDPSEATDDYWDRQGSDDVAGGPASPSMSEDAQEIRYDALRRESIVVGDRAYITSELVGTGGSGYVYLAIPRRPVGLGDGRVRHVAVKIVPRHRVRNAEAAVLTRVRCPEVLYLIDHGELGATRDLVLATEYHERTSVDRFLFGPTQSLVTMSVSTLLWCLDDLVTALGSVWGHGVIHADGKPENVLVATATEEQRTDRPFRFVLCDFGESFFMKDIATADPGLTEAYAPPEVAAWAYAGTAHHEGAPHTMLSDVFSTLGGTLFYILSGGLPPVELVPLANRVSVMTGPNGARDAAGSGRQTRAQRDPHTLTAPRALVDLAALWLAQEPQERVPANGGRDGDHLAVVHALRGQLQRARSTLSSSELEVELGGVLHPAAALPDAPLMLPDGYRSEMKRRGLL